MNPHSSRIGIDTIQRQHIFSAWFNNAQGNFKLTEECDAWIFLTTSDPTVFTPPRDQEADRLETRERKVLSSHLLWFRPQHSLDFDPRQTHPSYGQQIAFLQLPRLYLWIPENRSKSNWRHKSWVLFLFLQEKLVNKSSYKSAMSWFFLLVSPGCSQPNEMTEAGYPLCIVGALSMRWLNRYYQTSNIVDIVGEHPGIADHPKSSFPQQSGPGYIRSVDQLNNYRFLIRDGALPFMTFLIISHLS